METPQQILDRFLRDQKEISFSKDQLTAEQRIELTVLADRVGCVFYKHTEPKAPTMYILCQTKNCQIDFSDPRIWEKFEEMTNCPKEVLVSLIVEHGIAEKKHPQIAQKYKTFIEDLRRYGLSGLIRRHEIFREYIVKMISSKPKYQEYLKSNPVLLGKLSKPLTIHKGIYTPEADQQIFISLDVKSAIFVAYHQLGIIEEETWDEFMGKFTNNQLIINDKDLRLKIFGHLDTNKKNKIIIPNTILPIWNQLKGKFEPNLVGIEGDELVLTSTIETYQTMINEILSYNLPKCIKVECFMIKHLTNPETNSPYYLKEFLYPQGQTPIPKCLTSNHPTTQPKDQSTTQLKYQSTTQSKSQPKDKPKTQPQKPPNAYQRAKELLDKGTFPPPTTF